MRLERDFKDQERLNPKEESQGKWQVHNRRQGMRRDPRNKMDVSTGRGLACDWRELIG